MGFNLIYCTPMGGSYFLSCSNLEKYGKFWKNGRFFQADMAGLGKYCMGGYGRIGVYRVNQPPSCQVYSLVQAGTSHSLNLSSVLMV